MNDFHGSFGHRQHGANLGGIKRRAFCEEIDGISLCFEEIFLERQDEPLPGVQPSETMDGAGRHEDQRVRLDGEMIKIDVERRGAMPHPEDLVKIVPVRALPILAESKRFFKCADVKFFTGADSIVGK